MIIFDKSDEVTGLPLLHGLPEKERKKGRI
jgi:hypothetical protein